MWKYNFRGFSLVELLVTMGIIAIVSAGAMSLIGPGPKRTARDTNRISALATIVSALEIYRSDNPGYPACPSGTNCLPFVITNYLDTVPTDPYPGRNYRYIPSNCTGSYCKGYRLCAALEKVTTADASCVGSCGSTCSYSVAGP